MAAKKSICDPSLRDAIIDLYLNVKIRSNEEVSKFNEKTYQSEKAGLKSKDPFLILDYIRSSVEILMNLKAEDASPKSEAFSNTDPQRDYEQMLQKLEAEARNHIRVEQQLKLHIESLQGKLDDLSSLKQEYKLLAEELNVYKEQVKQKTVENEKLKKELKEASEKFKNLTMKASKEKAENDVSKLSFMRLSGTESSKTTHNISMEEKLAKFHSEMGPLGKIGELAKRNAMTATSNQTKEPNNNNNKVVTHKGVGINEQNIIQIICKSSDPSKESNAELLKIYKGKLEEKEKEIAQLKATLAELQNSGKKKGSLSTAIMNSYKVRCKSQSCVIRLAIAKIDPKAEAYNKKEVSHATIHTEANNNNRGKYSKSAYGTHKRSVGGSSSVYNDKLLDRSTAVAKKVTVERKRPATSCEGLSKTAIAKSNQYAQSTYTQSHKLLKLIENKLEAITSKRTIVGKKK